MQKRGLTKKKIVQASAQLIEETGLDHLSLKKVAEYLQISSPSLYNYFKDVNDLKFELSMLLMNRLSDRISMATIGRSASDAIMAMSEACYSFAKENPELYKTILLMPSLSEKLIDRGKQLTHVIELIFQSYGLNAQQTTYKTRELRSMIHGFISLEQAGYFRRDVSVTESYKKMISDFILQLENDRSNG